MIEASGARLACPSLELAKNEGNTRSLAIWAYTRGPAMIIDDTELSRARLITMRNAVDMAPPPRAVAEAEATSGRPTTSSGSGANRNTAFNTR